MLNSIEHKILIAHKYENIMKFSIFQAQIKPRMLFFLFTNVGNLTFMSRKNFMLNSVEHEKSFITSGPGAKNYKMFTQIGML